jgi:Tol biopolymer transport system component/DNA-binding winged helix-turn-helix (wHTH) protein
MVAERISTPDFAVGRWVVRPTLSRIESESGTVHVTPRAMAVLVHLAAAGGRVVPRSELFDVVWPRMAVGPDALSQCLLELRKAFQDDARNPSVIETVPKIGVRLMTPIVALGAEAARRESPVTLMAVTDRHAMQIAGPPDVAPANAQGRRANGGLRAAAWGVAALVVAAGGAVGAFWLIQGEPAASDPLAGAQFKRITDYVGVEENAAISPDGQFIAFVSDRDGAWDVWLGMAERGEFRNLTRGAVEDLRNPAVRMLAFSPSGSDLVLWTKTTDANGIITDHTWQIPILGGELRRHRSGASELDWSPDAARLVYHPSAPGDPLLVAPADDPGAGREIHAALPGVHNHFPLWSYDGTTIYFAQGFPPDDMDLWQIPASGGTPARLTFHDGRVGFPVVLDERTLLYLATAQDGSGPWIYSLDLESRTSSRLGTGTSQYASLAASVDRQRLVATEARLSATLWRAAIADTGTDAPIPVSLPTSLGVSPQVGADRIFYRAPHAGTDTLWSLAADGTAVELWNGSDGRVIAGPSVSPQGDLLAFSVRASGRAQLYVMNVDGSEARKVANGLDVRGAPAWAPSGESLAVAAIHSGAPRLFNVAVSSGDVILMSEDDALDPTWSPSGDFIVYTGVDVGGNIEIKAVNADGTPRPLPRIVVTRGSRRLEFLGPRDDLLVITKGPLSQKEFWLVDLVSTEQRRLSDFGAGPAIIGFDVSADGREVVFDRVREESDIVLISRGAGRSTYPAR